MQTELPTSQAAVQLIGPDQLTFNESKDVPTPGPYQILCRVEVVGLCFSDLKLLKQFSDHVRKGPIVKGIDEAALSEIASYVPNEQPTVPGHETVVTVLAMGEKVSRVEVGGRYLVQADYRWLKTANSNAAFGYNFEGALQQYVLLDERVYVSDQGESMMIPVEGGSASASAIALVEPWACVEDAYVNTERSELSGEKMLLVVESDFDSAVFQAFIARYGKPSEITTLLNLSGEELGVPGRTVASLDETPDGSFSDIVYYGSNPVTVEALFAKLAHRGLLNLVLCGGRFGREVETMIGRVHYGFIRIIGTTGSDPAESMEIIPATDEIRRGDTINVVGAGGPMGVMHVIRNICQGVADISVYAGDLDDHRLDALSGIAQPLAEQNGVGYTSYNSKKQTPDVEFDYTAIMAPIPALVANAVQSSGDRALINIFAGIPATVSGKMNLDRYIEKQMYFIGTSGSTLDDMKIVLDKVLSGRLDTNLSVGAICGLASSIDGIRAVENRSVAGKILCYPACKDLPLVTLEQLPDAMPAVAAQLTDGIWTKNAELALLDSAAGRP